MHYHGYIYIYGYIYTRTNNIFIIPLFISLYYTVSYNLIKIININILIEFVIKSSVIKLNSNKVFKHL